MKGNMEERACALAAYIIENRATVRAAAKKFGVSKSTVQGLTGPPAAVQPQPILAGQGGAGGQQGQRHIRGGMAAKKYKGF